MRFSDAFAVNVREKARIGLCCVQSCPTLQPYGLQPARLLSTGFSRQEDCSELPGSSPEDLPTQGSNLCLLRLLHCRQILYPLSFLGSLLGLLLKIKNKNIALITWIKMPGFIFKFKILLVVPHWEASEVKRKSGHHQRKCVWSVLDVFSPPEWMCYWSLGLVNQIYRIK